ncbi:MAG: hypothetical protein ACK55Z_34565, partial [bacterium]
MEGNIGGIDGKPLCCPRGCDQCGKDNCVIANSLAKERKGLPWVEKNCCPTSVKERCNKKDAQTPCKCKEQGKCRRESPKYGLTFVATGCCNYQAENSSWLSTSPSNVFNDMYTYCTLVKGGSASASQRSLCGCGATPPSTCTLQSAYTYSPRPPATNMGQISNLTTGEWRQLCVPLGLFFDHTDARDPVEYLSLTAWSATQSNITWDHVGVGKCGLDYSCSCATGYLPGTEKCVGSKFKCDDINECANLNASNLC